ncbi:GNAT family N-acetyltransferase [Glutamicibacter ardleyensis]|uniref:GNAT family N-acetyltransferase n=1 Tax=Glutamicibacter ardleyensis TaxID=225894 RepID=UPI003FD0CDEF
MSTKALGGSASSKYWKLQRDGIDYDTSVVAIQNNVIIGTVFSRGYSLASNSLKVKVGTQTALAVNPDFRGRGVGLALMQEANDRYKASGFDIVLGWPEYPTLDMRAGFKSHSTYFELFLGENTGRLFPVQSSISVSELKSGQSPTTSIVFAGLAKAPIAIYRNEAHERRYFADHGPAKYRIRLTGRNQSYAIVSLNSSAESALDEIHGFTTSDRLALIEYAVVKYKLTRIKHVCAQDYSAIKKMVRITDLRKRELFAQSYSSVGEAMLSSSIQSEYF